MFMLFFIFAAVFTVMSLFGALAIFTTIHFCCSFFFAAIFTVMPFLGAFTIFTAIHLFTVRSGYSRSLIFATCMKFIICFSSSFYTYIIIAVSYTHLTLPTSDLV